MCSSSRVCGRVLGSVVVVLSLSSFGFGGNFVLGRIWVLGGLAVCPARSVHVAVALFVKPSSCLCRRLAVRVFVFSCVWSCSWWCCRRVVFVFVWFWGKFGFGENLGVGWRGCVPPSVRVVAVVFVWPWRCIGACVAWECIFLVLDGVCCVLCAVCCVLSRVVC